MGSTNTAPSKPYSSGSRIKMSPLKDNIKSGSVSTKRSKPGISGK